MAVVPIIERELRVALRKRAPARSRLMMASACAGGALLLLLVAALTGSRTAGRTLQQGFCLVGLFIVLRTPQLTAGIFSEERRNQTLGLLFLSGLTAGEVFLSKVLSAALIAFTELLAIFPMLALPFLIGGVSFDLFLATVFALPGTLVFALAVSLLGSILAEDDGTAVILTVVVAILLCAVTPAIYLAQAHFSPAVKPSLWWLRLSPAYGPWLVWSGLRFGTASEFWRNLALTLTWSGLCLGAAAFVLNRLWQAQVQNREPAHWRARWQGLVHGDRRWRGWLAALWLDRNPFTWLAGRDREPERVAWCVLVGGGALWVLCWLTWGRSWLSVPNFFVTATLCNLAVGWLIRYTAARGIGEPRRDGGYELLLTTPLSPSHIVHGQLEALRLQFRPVRRAIVGLELVMVLGGLLVRPWTAPGLGVYFIVWGFLLYWAWSQGRRGGGLLPVMWASLNCGRPAHAAWRTTGLNSWSWIWIFFNLRHGLSSLPVFPTGSVAELIVVSVFGLIFLGVLLIRRLRGTRSTDPRGRRLVMEFREIVREPLPDPQDPRFKKWDVRERFPWGWGMVQHQLHERLARR